MTLTPGSHLEVEDVLDGSRHVIQERGLSGSGVDGLYLPLRVTRVSEWNFVAMGGPPLTNFQIARAFAHLESLGAELTPDGLRRSAHLVGRLWEFLLDSARNPPRLCNTEGEPMEFQTATFRVADHAALDAALRLRADLDYDDGDGCWVWTRPGGPGGVGRVTLLGRLQVIDDRLVVEVNSVGRLLRARAWIEKLAGVQFERATAREPIAAATPLDDRLRSTKREKVSPELVEHLRSVVLETSRRWLDESVPALGGRTPRQACATAEGRKAVERMVRTMPPMHYPGGRVEPPRDDLLRELGLSPGV